MSETNNFESYNLEEENDIKRQTMWSLVPRVMTMPTSGWERMQKHGPSPEIAIIRYLFPISLLSGGAEFFSLVYPGQVELSSVLVAGVIQFCSFFIGYFFALILAGLFLPKAAKGFPATQYGKLLTMTAVSTLAIFHLLFKALPMFDFVFEFLPIWTIFLVYKGMLIAGIQKEKAAFSMGVMCLVTIASPVIVAWVFSLFI